MSCHNLRYVFSNRASGNNFARKGGQFSGRDETFLGNDIPDCFTNIGNKPLCDCNSSVYRIPN